MTCQNNRLLDQWFVERIVLHRIKPENKIYNYYMGVIRPTFLTGEHLAPGHQNIWAFQELYLCKVIGPILLIGCATRQFLRLIYVVTYKQAQDIVLVKYWTTVYIRRLPSIKSTLAYCLVFAGMYFPLTFWIWCYLYRET